MARVDCKQGRTGAEELREARQTRAGAWPRNGLPGVCLAAALVTLSPAVSSAQDAPVPATGAAATAIRDGAGEDKGEPMESVPADTGPVEGTPHAGEPEGASSGSILAAAPAEQGPDPLPAGEKTAEAGDDGQALEAIGGEDAARDAIALGKATFDEDPVGDWGGRRFYRGVNLRLTVRTSLMDTLRSKVDGASVSWEHVGDEWSYERRYEEGGPYALPLLEAVTEGGTAASNEAEVAGFGSFWVDCHAPSVTGARIEGSDAVWDEETETISVDGSTSASLVLNVSDEQGLASAELEGDGQTSDLPVEEGALTATLRIPLSEGLGADECVCITDLAGNQRVWNLSPEGETFDEAGSDAENAPVAIVAADGTERVVHPQSIVSVERPIPSRPRMAQVPRLGHVVDEAMAPVATLPIATPPAKTAALSEPGGDKASSATTVQGERTPAPATSEPEADDAGSPVGEVGEPASGAGELADRTIPRVTAPEVSLHFNDDAREESTYNHERTATVRVTGAAFDPSLVKVDTDGKVGSWNSVGGVHELPVTFRDDGEHRLRADYGGVQGSPVAAADSGAFRIDTTPPALDFSGISDGQAYGGAVAGTVTVHDLTGIDPSQVEVRLTRSDGKAVVQPQVSFENGEAHITLPDLPQTAEFDDVYTLSVSVRDQAGNEASSSTHFSLNRCGSTFEVLNEDLAEGTPYVRESPTVRIREINVSGTEVGKRAVWVTHDAETAELTAAENPGEGEFGVAEEPDARGWSCATYVIPRENFAQEGTYRIAVASEDLAGNHNLSLAQSGEPARAVSFVLDKTAPTVTLEGVRDGEVVAASSQAVEIRATDLVGVGDIEATLDGSRVEPEKVAEGVWRVTVDASKGKRRTLEVTASDLAGNEASAAVRGFRIEGVSAAAFIPGITSVLGGPSQRSGGTANRADPSGFVGTLCAGLAAGAAGLAVRLRRRPSRPVHRF